jgi:CRP-like cAMP-binding protein
MHGTRVRVLYAVGMMVSDNDVAWINGFIETPVLGKTLRRLLAGEKLYARGDPVTEIFLVRSGNFRVNATGPDGTIAVHEFVGPGEWLAIRALIGHTVHAYTVVATETSEVVVFQLPLFQQMSMEYPCLNRLLVQFMVHYVTVQQSAKDDHTFHSAEWRLARALHKRFPADDENVTSLTIDMSMAGMAELIGCSASTAKRFVQMAERQGMLARKKRTKENRTIYLYREPLREYLCSDFSDSDERPKRRITK